MSRYTGPRVRAMRALGVQLPGLSVKPIEKRPFPATGDADSADLDALVTPEDAFRARLAHAMYFRPAVITSLPVVAADASLAA